ncbi:hypothetical protein DZC75_10825 [Pseudomonas parafulva]|uniref:Uncharacterized protein n=1 Tax=Pseudomonas parafulva TaxID=157782 RepID=A0AAI8KBI1_9PSED|nr:hypothetical protein [Pseudomonas parafulva]AXO88464.1 hypothetical protein DZC75_10825 [Pseudomonas parafulva]
MSGLPLLWLAELDDRVALLADPDGRAAVLVEMAYAARRRQDVDAATFADMLELAEAGRAWALSEHEEVSVLGVVVSGTKEGWADGEPGQITVGRNGLKGSSKAV